MAPVIGRERIILSILLILSKTLSRRWRAGGVCNRRSPYSTVSTGANRAEVCSHYPALRGRTVPCVREIASVYCVSTRIRVVHSPPAAAMESDAWKDCHHRVGPAAYTAALYTGQRISRRSCSKASQQGSCPAGAHDHKQVRISPGSRRRDRTRNDGAVQEQAERFGAKMLPGRSRRWISPAGRLRSPRAMKPGSPKA